MKAAASKYNKLVIGVLTLLFLAGAIVAQYQMTGGPTGLIFGYNAQQGDVQGDTVYSVISPANGYYADGVTAIGTTTLNLNDGAGNRTISGDVYSVVNDYTFKGTPGDIGIYKINTLDLSNFANTAYPATLTNQLAGAGTTCCVVDAPTGWYGKVDSGDVTYTDAVWRNSPLFFMGGWAVLAIERAHQGGVNYTPFGASTIIVSPDGGKHWCNPYTFFNRSGGAGCDATNWSATGDIPICTASGGVHGGACTNSAYLDATHSSVMWPLLTPFDGKQNQPARPIFINMGQANSQTIGSYVYAYVWNGAMSGGPMLARVQNDVTHLLDPTQWQYYTCANYQPTNVCDGTVGGNWTTTLASATRLWDTRIGGDLYSLQLNPTSFALTTPTLLCDASSKCSIVFVAGYSYNWTYGMPITSAPKPWGPFVVTGWVRPTNGIANASTVFGFPEIMGWTMQADSTPGVMHGVLGFDNTLDTNLYTVSAATIANPAVITLAAPVTGGWSGTRPMNVSGATGCWTAVNGTNQNVVFVDYLHVRLTSANTSGCTGNITGTPVFTLGGNAMEKSKFYQGFNLSFAPTALGSSLQGYAGGRISNGMPSNSIPRKGLQYYWDFSDNMGQGSGWNPLAAYDRAQLVSGVFQSLPSSSLYYTESSIVGGTAGGTAWAVGGLNTSSCSTCTGIKTYDLTALTPNAINPAVFTGDNDWTISTVFQQNGGGASCCFVWYFGGDTTHNVQGYTASSGKFNVYAKAGSGSNTYQWTTNAATIANGNWYHVVVTHKAGQPFTNASTIIYVSGSGGTAGQTMATAGSCPGSCTVSPTAGQLILGYSPDFGASWKGKEIWGPVGVWNRALGATEVAAMYGYLKRIMAQRGVTLQ